MKPIKLVMSAFGSYAEETCIDFSKQDHGIFLITGDTGSGKTTIFDAICYALFDKTSGGAREGADMRSQYADPEIATFVEYTFSYGDDVYVIRRNPRYTRTSKRKDKDGNYKETTEQPGVELALPDGRVFQGKIKETNEKIVEIIGLDAEQFSQVVMIAQGEFMKLLQAPSNKRKEIFGRIFNTKIYWVIQEELKKQSKAIFIELEDNRKLCEALIQGVKQIPGEQEETVEFLECDQPQVLASLDKLITAGKAKQKEYDTLLKENQKLLNEKLVELKTGEANNNLIEKLEKAKEELLIVEGQKEKIQDFQSKIEAAQKALNVEKDEGLYQKSKKDRQSSEKRLQLAEKEIENADAQLKSAEEKKAEALKNKEENEVRIQNEITKIEESLPLYKEAEEYKSNLESIEKSYKKCEKTYNEKKAGLIKLQENLVDKHQKTTALLAKYQHENDMFVASMAGIMASELMQGNPCPVCGSTSHPCKATLSEDSVTQAMVNVTKEEWLQAQEQEKVLTDNISALSAEIEKASAELVSIQSNKDKLSAQYNALKERLTFSNEKQAMERLDNARNEYEKIINYLNKAEKLWQQSKEAVVEITGRINSEKASLEKLIADEKEYKDNYDGSITKYGFADEEDYLNRKLSQSQIKEYEQNISTYINKLISLQEEIKLLKGQTEGKSLTDVNIISQAIKEMESGRKQLEMNQKAIYAINQSNTEIKNRLVGLLDGRSELKQRYALYSNMDKTANGNLSGVAKLDFQTYIQRRYFEIMIREANKRLVKMTNNQFILQCRSLDKLGSQGSVGLDLDVYSLVNDKTRDVKTLSGGESFMAALSMALGMSDVIQNTAGKVRMDTMFVDEGFGSLDDESRNEAIKILLELAGDRRLVGIISHVSELKEQIDNKLIVEKDERGSKTYWIN